MAVMGVRIGIYNRSMSVKGGGEKRTLVLADHLSRNHQVFLIVPERPELSSLERYFDVDLGRVNVVSLDEPSLPGRCLKALGGLLSFRWENLVEQFISLRQVKGLKLDVFINNSYGSDLACPAPLGIYMCMFPHAPQLAVARRGLARRACAGLLARVKEGALGYHPNPIGTYAEVTANSQYTREWVEKLWGRRASVVYSACDHVEAPLDDAKEKIILNIGRFDVYKRQDIQLDVYKGLRELHDSGWQLHFVGSTSGQAETRGYTARLLKEAGGHPVFFHFDADLQTLRGLCRRASVYWHATGYGLPADEHPDKQEHFGMATVEAMSAGAVPVVINSGGQREIVRHGVNGFLWDDLRGLADNTRLLASDARLRRRLGGRARASVAKFSRADFNEQMDRILERMLRERGADQEELFR
jgi:glycosyltransferase involved in cell wall biosynthesis